MKDQGPFKFLNLDSDEPLPPGISPEMRKLVQRIRDRDGTDEELQGIVDQLQTQITKDLSEDMAKRLDRMLQVTTIYGKNTGQMPCVLTVGRSATKEESEGTGKIDLNPENDVTSIGLIITGRMNNDDVNMFTSYIDQFLRGLIPVGGKVTLVTKKDRLNPSPKPEEPQP